MYIDYASMYRQLLSSVSEALHSRPNSTMYGFSGEKLIKEFHTVAVGGVRQTGKSETALDIVEEDDTALFIARDENQANTFKSKVSPEASKRVICSVDKVENISQYLTFIVDEDDHSDNYDKLVKRLVNRGHNSLGQVAILKIL